MRYIPSRVSPWKRTAEAWHQHDNAVFCGLFEGVRDKIVRHHGLQSQPMPDINTGERGRLPVVLFGLDSQP